MANKSGLLHLFCWIGGVLLIALALCFAFVNYVPLLWGAGLAAAFVLYYLFASTNRKATAAGYVVVSCVCSCSFAWLIVTYVGVERIERYDCRWKAVAKGIEIDLSSIGGFGWGRVESAELYTRLQVDYPAKVSVELPVVRDFGNVRAIGVIHKVDGIPVRESSRFKGP